MWRWWWGKPTMSNRVQLGSRVWAARDVPARLVRLPIAASRSARIAFQVAWPVRAQESASRARLAACSLLPARRIALSVVSAASLRCLKLIVFHVQAAALATGAPWPTSRSVHLVNRASIGKLSLML